MSPGKRKTPDGGPSDEGASAGASAGLAAMAPAPPPLPFGVAQAEALSEQGEVMDVRVSLAALCDAACGVTKAMSTKEEKAASISDPSLARSKAALTIRADESPWTESGFATVSVDPGFPLVVVYETEDGEASTEVYAFASQALQEGLRKGDARGTAEDLSRARYNFRVLGRGQLEYARSRVLGPANPRGSDGVNSVVPLVDEATVFLRFAREHKELLREGWAARGGGEEGDGLSFEEELQRIVARARGFLKNIHVSTSLTYKQVDGYQIEGFNTYGGRMRTQKMAVAFADAIVDAFDEEGTELRSRPDLGTGLPYAQTGIRAKHWMRSAAGKRFGGVVDAVYVYRLAFSVLRLAHQALSGADDKVAKAMKAEEARWDFVDAQARSSRLEARAADAEAKAKGKREEATSNKGTGKK